VWMWKWKIKRKSEDAFSEEIKMEKKDFILI
jgi:hypothetical protein